MTLILCLISSKEKADESYDPDDWEVEEVKEEVKIDYDDDDDWWLEDVNPAKDREARRESSFIDGDSTHSRSYAPGQLYGIDVNQAADDARRALKDQNDAGPDSPLASFLGGGDSDPYAFAPGPGKAERGDYGKLRFKRFK